VGRANWRVAGLAIGLAFAGLTIGAGHATGPKVLKRLVLDDFEAPPGVRSYGTLDETLRPQSRGHIEWSRESCRRSGARGHCMHVRYEYTGEMPQTVSFRIDLGDLDATKYDHVELWIRGDSAGYSPQLKIGFRHPKPDMPRLMQDGTAVVTGIGDHWQRIVVPLNRMSGIGEWKHLRSFFLSLESRRAGAARRGGYEIDDVALLQLGGPGPTIADEVIPPQKRAWEMESGGAAAANRLAKQRLEGWPQRLLADKSTLPDSDREFLERLARDTWRGIVALTDRENGLPIDHVSLSASLAPPDSRVADYTNVTNVGLHLIDVVAADELGLITANEARARLAKVLDTLERLETRSGFFFNYYDTITLERSSNFISFVDSSWLTAGLMVVRSTYPELAARCTRLIDAGNYGFFYDDVAQQMWHGYYVNVPTRSEYHYGVLYTEPRLGSLIAIGKGDVPEDHWFALVRSYPPEADWQTQRPRDWKSRRVRGHVVESGLYEWSGERYVPSWGGSMFEALMPTLVLDEGRYAAKSLGRNDYTHAEVQRRYATEVLGYPVWGLSPCVNPSGKGYGEYGVKVLGSLGYGPGAVAPYAAALALGVLADGDAAKNLHELARRYDAYGEYGFYDSVDPRSGQVAHQYLALDQSMILISLANHLKDHAIHKRFAADPIAARVTPMLGDEDFFD
jgi:Putative glucoamylase/Protein of unknown function (DUF3131)